MNQKKGFSDYFEDDFEVTYEEEPDIRESSPDEDYHSQETIVMDPDEYDTRSRRSRYPDSGYEETFDRQDKGSSDRDRGSRSRNRQNERYTDQESDSRQKRSSRRRRSRGVPLAAPIRKGGRALSRLASALVRSLTALLILAVTAYVTWTFWRASTPYGDIIEAVEKKSISMTLAAYLCAPALFLLFEFISLCWSMTRVRVRDGMQTWKEDTGRGLFSFLFVFASSYVCFLFSRFLPESPDVLYGIKGAAEVYGSMHNVLFGLCAAGVVSCIVRKCWSNR